MKTDQKNLEDLYDAQVKAMQAALDEGDTPAATLAVIAKFLKDAGVQAKPVRGSALGNLANSLPTFDGDDADDAPILPN